MAASLFAPGETTASSSLGYTRWLETIGAEHFPGYNWHYDYLVRIRKQLARVTRGECKRLVLSLPPQHGKTTGLTVPYPVWRLEREPTLRVAVGAYNQTHANRFSRKSRRIAATRLELSRDRKAVNEWETAAGGYYVAVGVGAGITGLPVDLLIVDDPVKNAEEAMSEARREAVWEWWTDSLFTRLSKDAAVVIVMTRWHTEDLAGRLIKQGGWEQAVFPAIAEADDPLGRPEGQALCPELHPIEQLTAARDQSPTSFRALYQQQPLDLTGGFFRGLEKVPILDVAPTPDQFTSRCRYWDLAATEAQAGADPDWTVGALVAKHRDGTYWVLDVQRARLGPSGVRGLIRQTAAADGKAVRVRVEREGGASGKLAADSIVREDLAGFSAAAVKPKGNKAERAEPFASQVEAGNVRLVAGAWVRAWLDELRAFPTGKHDDQCVPGHTRILTAAGWDRIDGIRPGAMVMTRDGWREVLQAGRTGTTCSMTEIDTCSGAVVQCTGNHPVYVVGRGWIPAAEVVPGDEVLQWSPPKRSSGTAGRGGVTRTPNSGITGSTTSRTPSGRIRPCSSTASCGSPSMATSPTAATSTTGTTTRLTTTSPTSSASRRPNTAQGMAASRRLTSGHISPRSAGVLQSGTGPTPAGSGTPPMPQHPWRLESPPSGPAVSAGFCSVASTATPGSAAPSAGRLPVDPATSLTPASVSSAVPGSLPNEPTPGFAPSRVRAVRAVVLQDPVPVFNLQVDGTPEYVADGILVHNCDASSGGFSEVAAPGWSVR